MPRQQELKIWLYTAIPKLTSQVNNDYECKNGRMKKYLEQVQGRVSSLRVKFVQIPREENEHTDLLAKATLVEHMVIPG